MKPVDYFLKFHTDFYHPINEGIKVSTIRDESKPLNINDICVAYFPLGKKALLLRIDNHYAKRLKDLGEIEAQNEGYYHPDMLRHELVNIYPNLTDEDYVYIYEFTLVKGYRQTVLQFLKDHEGEL